MFDSLIPWKIYSLIVIIGNKSLENTERLRYTDLKDFLDYSSLQHRQISVVYYFKNCLNHIQELEDNIFKDHIPQIDQ